jgi:hypothetical protein
MARFFRKGRQEESALLAFHQYFGIPSIFKTGRNAQDN